jgi:hypothetical protein
MQDRLKAFHEAQSQNQPLFLLYSEQYSDLLKQAVSQNLSPEQYLSQAMYSATRRKPGKVGSK